MMFKSRLGGNDVPATKNEWAKIVECMTEIRHLKESLEKIRQDLKAHVGEEIETQRYFSTRKLAMLMIIATICGGILGSLFFWILTKFFP